MHPQCDHICPSQRKENMIQTFTHPVLHSNSALRTALYVATDV